MHCRPASLPDDLTRWPDEALRAYFFCGESSTSTNRKSSKLPNQTCSNMSQLEQERETGNHHTLPARLPAPDETLPGQDWRQSAAVRRTHWLCQPCALAIPRSQISCFRCHKADHSSSALTTDTVERIIERIPSCARLCSLDLSHTPLGAPGVAAVARVLSKANGLRALNLSGTGASDSGAKALAEVLGGTTSVRSLQLIGAFVKDEGGIAFATLLRSGCSLEELGLGWNDIRGVDAAKALGEAAADATLLVSFCGVPIGELRAGRLPRVPPLTERDRQRRPVIEPTEELHLQGHGCGAPGAQAITSLLPRLLCGGAPPSPVDVPRKLKLSAIVMPFQDLRDEGGEVIAHAAASYCPDLRFLMLSRNDVGAAATARIRKLLPELDDFHLRVNNRGG